MKRLDKKITITTITKLSFSLSLILLLSLILFFGGNDFFKKDPRAVFEQSVLDKAREAGLDKADKEVDMPGMSAFQDYFTTADPALGRVPVERLAATFEQLKADARNPRLKSGRELDWDIVPSNMGGRTRCVLWDPNDPDGNKVWAGAVTGGLWYNDNIYSALSSWQPVDDFWASLSISSIEYDPNEPMTMYVGTGEAFTALTIYRESTGVGVGIYKTTDGGESWELLSSTTEFKYITDIEVRDENGSSVIYAGVVSGVYQGAQHESQPSDGLYRSADGGGSWLQVMPLIPGTSKPYPVADIEITTANRLIVGSMRNLDGDGGATILWSDNGLIGSWTVYDDYVSIIQNDPDYYVPGRVMIGSAPSDPDIAYALFDAGYVSNSNGFTYSRGRYIARTDDGGESWNYRPIPSGGNYYWATIGWHALTVGVNENNPDEVFIGGLDVYKSSNGGMNWNRVSDWALMYYGGGPEYVHADIHDIDYKPGSSNELLVSSDGGVFYTDNATSYQPDFQEKNTGFGSLQFYVNAIDPTPGTGKYVGGLQDNGTLYYTGPALTINHMIDGGDGAYCFIDENEPQYMITSVYYNRYTLFINGNWAEGMGDWESGTFISPADYDYKLNILYANACEFSGSRVNQILRISNIPANPQGSFRNLGTGLDTWFSHVKYSPLSPEGTSTLFVGSLSGRLFKVTNAQASHQVTEIGSPDFPVANLSCVAIGNSEDTLLVTFSNYGVSSVWKTMNGGESWTEVEGNLPDIPVRWCLLHPQGSQYAMLATDLGIWTTSDLHEAEVEWVNDNEGLANVRVDMLDLRTSDNTVLAATHGRGMATAVWDIATGLGEEAGAHLCTLYPNPSNGQFRLETQLPGTGPVKISIISLQGKNILNEHYASDNAYFEKEFNLQGLPAGQYILKVSRGSYLLTKKLIIKK
jgi:photosystem II stability/assembly factor-like uncharacterized protein